MNQEVLFKKIQSDIDTYPVLLYMKGNKDIPQCGFSAFVCGVLQKLNVTFEERNVLADNELREGIKRFSNWPTVPQLYVKGKFVGGCDIVKEMYSSGELQKILGAENQFPAGA